jgi:hypothetical protein
MINFFILRISILWSLFHPFHVSVCEVIYSETDKSIQVSQRVFMDDFEAALNKRFEVNLVIDDSKVLPMRDSLIALYLNEKLAIRVNGKEVDHRYIGSEIEEDGIWCYIEYPGVKKIKSIEVRSSVFLEQFDDQANIVYFQVYGKEKNIKLDRKKSTYLFDLEVN